MTMNFWQTLNKLLDSHTVLLFAAVVLTGLGAYLLSETPVGALWFDLFKFTATSYTVFITTKWGTATPPKPPPATTDKKETLP